MFKPYFQYIYDETYSTQIEDPTLLSLWTFFTCDGRVEWGVIGHLKVGIVNFSWKNQTCEEILNSRTGVPYFTLLWTQCEWTWSIIDNGFKHVKSQKENYDYLKVEVELEIEVDVSSFLVVELKNKSWLLYSLQNCCPSVLDKI